MTTPTQQDPLEMPTWLTRPQDRRWWGAMTLTIRTIRKEADESYREGMKSSFIAEDARADYNRLNKENRERFAARGEPAHVADAAFSNYQVTRDCIDTEQMHGRWSQERLLKARAGYEQVTRLMEQLSQFLVKRQSERRVPSPRSRGE